MKTLAELFALPERDIYELRQVDYYIAQMSGLDVDWVGGKTIYYSREEGRHGWQIPVPAYSTDMADAWPLLAEMLAAGITVTLWPFEGNITIMPDYPNVRHFSVPLADAPLGISRAFATWKMGDE